MHDRTRTCRFLTQLAGLLTAALVFSVPVALGQEWLVLPFANESNEPSLDWLGEGFAMSLEEHLRGGGQQTVPYDKARELLLEWNVPRGRAVTMATALKAADRTGAVRLVTGSFTVADGEVSVEGQVIDPLGPEILGKVREKARLGHLLELHGGLARDVWRAGRNEMPQFRAPTGTGDPQPLTAYEQYVRARLEEESSKRLQKLRKAASSFPTYVLLQYRLAEALNDAGLQEEALLTLERLHPARFILTPEALLLEGELHFRRDDPQGAQAAVKAALDIQDSAEGRLLHAEILLALGLEDEARAELERSRELGIPLEDYEALSSKMPTATSGSQP